MWLFLATARAQIKLAPLSDGTISLTGSGLAGIAYSIQASTDLGPSAWTNLVIINANTSGLFSYVDPRSEEFSYRFYRSQQLKSYISRGGLIAKGTITMTGGFLDSFNSSLGPYTIGVHGTNAVALSNTNVAGAINLSGADIYGIAVTGPGGTVSTSSGAAVGNVAWIAETNTGVQLGWSADDANFQFNDVAEPFLYGSGLTPASGTVDGVSYTWVLPSGNYQMGSVSISGGRTMLVTGDVTLYVNGNLSTSGAGAIIIVPGASLKLYVAGSANFTGNGIVNQSGLARNLSIYGLNTCPSIAYSGTSALIGTVNAPEAALKFSGISSAFGAFTANSITISGGSMVHYDEALSGN